MRGWIVSASLLLSAGAAQGKEFQAYDKVGDWEIVSQDGERCAMKRSYGSVVADQQQGLVVMYNAQRQRVSLGWASNKPKFLPAHGSLYLDLIFVKKSSSDESWGSQSFDYDKQPDTYFITHVFTGSAEAERILRDLASNEVISFFLGPTLMMGLPLDASAAVKKLRECALTGGGSGTQ